MATPPVPKMPDELKSAIQQMQEQGVPDDVMKEVINKYADAHDTTIDQTLNEFKGVIEGLIPGAWGSVRGLFYDLPKGVYSDLNAIAKGEDPEFVKKVFTDIVSLPGQFMTATHEDRGKMIGNALGGFVGAKGIGEYAPVAPKVIAKGTGQLMETVGKKGGWPIRMMGAHQLGAGNPLGAAMMAAPELLIKGGQKIQSIAGSGNEAVPAMLDRPAGKPSTGGIAPAIPPKINTTPDVIDRAMAGGAVTPPSGGGGISAIERAQLVKQGYPPDMIARLEKASAAPTPGGVRITPPAPKPPVPRAPIAGPPEVPVEGRAPYTGAAAEIMHPGAVDYMNKEFAANAPIARRVLAGKPAVDPTIPRDINLINEPKSGGLGPADMPRGGSVSPEGVVSPEPVSPAQAARPPQPPVEDRPSGVPASKSKIQSEVQGLSAGDIQRLAEHFGATPIEVENLLKEGRSQSQSTKISDYYLDKAYRESLEKP